MATLRASFCLVTFCKLLTGCGSTDATAPAPAAKATKADVVAFLKDELRVPSGASYDLRTVPEVSETELAAVSTGLKKAGYRFVGGNP